MYLNWRGGITNIGVEVSTCRTVFGIGYDYKRKNIKTPAPSKRLLCESRTTRQTFLNIPLSKQLPNTIRASSIENIFPSWVGNTADVEGLYYGPFRRPFVRLETRVVEEHVRLIHIWDFEIIGNIPTFKVRGVGYSIPSRSEVKLEREAIESKGGDRRKRTSWLKWDPFLSSRSRHVCREDVRPVLRPS